MGNKCFKKAKKVTLEANFVSKSRRWRLFRVMGLGKYCAKVDIQREDLTKESDEDIGAGKSVKEWMEADPDLFNTVSSLISMLDDETSELDEAQDEPNEIKSVYSETIEKTDLDQKVETKIALHDTVLSNKDEKVADGEHVSEENKDVDNKDETQTGSHIRNMKTDEYKMLNYAKADVAKETVSETQQKSTNEIEKDMSSDKTSKRIEPNVVVTSSKSSSSSDDGILQRRPLSPKFFSTDDNRPYEEFEGEVEEEIEECIEVEDKDNYDDMEIAAVKSGELESKKATKRAGKGNVCLAEEDVKVAISKLAFLREEKDANIDYMDSKATEESSKPTTFDVTMESNLRKDHQDEDYDHAFDSPVDEVEQVVRADTTDTKIKIEKVRDSQDPEHGEPFTSSGMADSPVPYEDRKSTSLQYNKANIDKTIPHTLVSAPDWNMKGSIDLDKTAIQGTVGKTDTTKQEVSSSISLAIALSLEAIKNHNSRCDCMISFYVRSPQVGQEPRMIEARASAGQIKDGSAEKHIRMLKNIQMPAKLVCQVPVTPKIPKKHLFTFSALAASDATNVVRWIQKQGPPDLAKTSSVPTCYEATERTQNPREKLGLEKLQKFKIGLQCKQIERIKIDAEEFPGILPPKIREKWQKKMDKKKHIN